MSEDDQDSSRRYWKAAISALPTAEKRDAAWEFYLDKFAGTSAGENLGGGGFGQGGARFEIG